MRTDPMKMTLLFDEYGALLTEKQRDCFDLYFNQDLSLGEIADELGISRQGVHDTLSRAEAALSEWEAALGNVARNKALRRAAQELRSCIEALSQSGDPAMQAVTARIQSALKTLEE